MSAALSDAVMPRSRCEISSSHRALRHPLVVAEGAGLAQQHVDQCRLAVIDMGNDSDVAEGHAAEYGFVWLQRNITCVPSTSRLSQQMAVFSPRFRLKGSGSGRAAGRLNPGLGRQSEVSLRCDVPPRRLTVLASLDVAGYTRLIDQDERGTLSDLARDPADDAPADARRPWRQPLQDHGRRRPDRVPERRGRGRLGDRVPDRDGGAQCRERAGR